MVLFAVRVWLSAFLRLTPDESYYWLWSRFLDWSYFDHPPLTAWLIRGSTALLGPTPLAVRLPAQVCLGLALVLVAAAGRDLAGRTQAGLAAALILSATLLFGAGGFLMTPDAPLILGWALALFAWGRLAATGRARWWPLIGAAVGLGFLGKYSILFLPAALGLWCLVSPAGRRWLRSPWPYLAGLIALVAALPVVAWNVRHDWISLAWQAGHGLGGRGGLSPGKLGQYLGGQAGVITPVLFGTMVLAAGVLFFRGWRQRRDGWLILGLAALVPLLFFALTALFGQQTQANWPAPAYLAAALAVGALLAGRWWRIAARTGVIVGLAMILAVTVHLVRPWLPLPVQDDRTYEFKLWPQLGDRIRSELRAFSPRRRVFLLSDQHQLLAAAAFAGAPQAPALDLTQPWRYLYDPRLGDLAGWDALLLTRQGPAQVRLTYGPGFKRITPLKPRFEPRYRGQVINDYACRLYRLQDFAGGWYYWLGYGRWPIPPTSSRTSP